MKPSISKPKTYTLQRLLFEANALIEKYNLVEDDFTTSVSFDIDSRHGHAIELKALIIYKSNNDRRDYKYFTSERTPEAALIDFEELLRKASGITWNERLSIELTETNN